MSLLMEALRKAEADQRQMQEEKARLAAEPNAESAATPPPLASQTHAEPPMLDLQVQAVSLGERDVEMVQRATEEELHDYLNRPRDLDEIAPLPPRQSPLTSLAAHPTPLTDRQSAASVFSAKNGRTRGETRSRTRMGVLAAGALLMVPLWFAMMWYFGQQGGSSLGLDPSIANYDLSGRGFLGENPASAVVQPTPPAAIPPVERAGVPSSAEAAPSPNETTPVVTDAVMDASTAISAPASIPVPPSSSLPTIDDTASAVAPGQTLEIRRATNRNTVDPRLQDAYSMFRAGDLSAAAQRYQLVIAGTPDNRDALLGLAAIALQQQNPAQARSYYSRLLDLNPQDHLARTGLLQSLDSLSSTEKENTLRSMVSAAPESAPLHFALGNLYAEQQRWADAQAAYFNALLQARRATAEAINPDYPFNLAVSLERLGQSKAAVEYYREAQNLARTTRGSFDTALLNQRLATLEQLLP